MRFGTPGFNGSRLREARQARGLTGVSLSEVADVPAKAISTYENGHSTPSAETLDSLASALRMPASFLLLPDRHYERGTVFNRSMSAATKGARIRSDLRLTWLRDIVHYLSDYVGFPQSNFPDLGLPADPLMLTDDEIEFAADSLRSYWNMRRGPISNMVLLLENQGAIVARDLLGSQNMEGKSEFPPDEGRPFVLIGADKGSPVRWRFDAAHELGHLILHAHVGADLLARTEHFNLLEEQAHRFAGAFLLPAAEFGDEMYAPTLENFRSMKRWWKVSIAAMITRAGQLGYITEDVKRGLWVTMSRRKWRTHEPEDDTMEIERPRLLRRAFEMILAEGIQTPDDVLAALSLPAADVEALTGMERGYLGSFSPVTLFGGHRPAGDDEEIADPNRTPGVVLQLPFGRRTT